MGALAMDGGERLRDAEAHMREQAGEGRGAGEDG
ncbi:hypothetical protein EVA_18591, partial [gut metagenome]